MVQYSNERLLDALHECKRRHGKITTQLLNEDDSLPSGATYSYRFESLAAAARRAGLGGEADRLERNSARRTGYSDDEIRQFLARLADGNTVTPKEIVAADGPSYTTVRKRFGDEGLVGRTVNGVRIVRAN